MPLTVLGYKRCILGRYTEAHFGFAGQLRVHLWRRLVDSPIHHSSLSFWSNTEALAAFYRLLGARVGRNTWLTSSFHAVDYDTLEFGDLVTMGGNCQGGGAWACRIDAVWRAGTAT